VALSAVAVAEDEPSYPPSYSAVGVIQLTEDVSPLRIFQDRGRERREQTADGSFHIMIKRPDMGLIYVVIPDSNMAMEMASSAEDMQSAESGFIAEHDLEELGVETVAGEPATKYSMPRQPDEPQGMTTFIWLTQDRIPVKLLGHAGERRVLYMELFKVDRGPQDPTMFELPPGMQAMRMPDGMQMPGVERGTPSRQPGAADIPTPSGTQGIPESQMPDLSEMMTPEQLEQLQQAQEMQKQMLEQMQNAQ
jgi:hypothetical protein